MTPEIQPNIALPHIMKSREISPEELVIAEPHGLCRGAEKQISGITRIMDIIGGQDVLHMHNPPLHNKRLLQELEIRGLVIHPERKNGNPWEWDWSGIPDKSPYGFPAHGARPEDYQIAEDKELLTTDGTCMLVVAEHKKVAYEISQGKTVLLFGKEGHPEPRGTMGVAEKGKIIFIANEEDLLNLEIDPNVEYAWANQTTQSTREIMHLKNLARERIPGIRVAGRGQGCYATDDRQEAVVELAKEVDAFIVVTSEISNNGTNLVKRAEEAGIPAYLIQGGDDLRIRERFGKNSGIRRVGISSAASTMEKFLQEPIAIFEDHGVVVRSQLRDHREPNEFPLPGLNEAGFIARFGDPADRKVS